MATEIKKIPIRINKWHLEIDENRIYPPKKKINHNGTMEIIYETGKIVNFKLLVHDSNRKFGNLTVYDPNSGKIIHECGRTAIENSNDFNLFINR